MGSLGPRHIQNFSEASALEPHWGYADRVIPCTNDAGSCQYLDVVYHSHDLGMLYSGILWATVGSILLIWAVARQLFSTPQAGSTLLTQDESSSIRRSGIRRLQAAVASCSRRLLLPEFMRPVFGRTTRLQVLILTILVGYLTIWSFVGIVYNTWVTPVKKLPGVYNTRTSLGPWSDRVGTLAYALTPLSVLLSSRESLLSLITGVPYQSFNFMHRWLGYLIFAQSALHTVGWTIIEARLYQPQPTVARQWISQLYMIWGVVAIILLSALVILSTPWGIRLTGYEFFRKSHYALAMLYIGACIGHWAQLQCFLVPSLVIWFLDRAVRAGRTDLLHYNYINQSRMGFAAAKATATYFCDPAHGDVVRLDFEHPGDAWEIGQHFYLCFTEGSIWQSHPFTPLSLPGTQLTGQRHSYVFRAKGGETKKIANIVSSKKSSAVATPVTTPVILTGPYGRSIIDGLREDTNTLCVAGGTGITFVLPILLHLISQRPSSSRKVELVWAIRRRSDIEWVRPELDVLRNASRTHNVEVRIFITREDNNTSSTVGSSEISKTAVLSEDKEISSSSASSASSSEDTGKAGSKKRSDSVVQTSPAARHPDLAQTVNNFVNSTMLGSTKVFASGPGSMMSDLRTVVAACNSGSRVWKGDDKFDVDFVSDNRLE